MAETDNRAVWAEADWQAWLREGAGDNSEQLERLRRSLRIARRQELTERQQLMLRLYFDQGKSMTQIAAETGVNRSTVCQTLRRARERLYRCLQYEFLS